MMMRFLIGCSRFALSAWVGAAALFVVTGIREVRSSEIDSRTRDVLVGLRFPAYYVCGFTLVGLALAALLLSTLCATAKRGRMFALTSLVFVAMLVMVGDYVWVYQPLLEMITPPGQSRPANFVAYHEASKWLNLLSVSLCAIAGLTLCWQSPPTHSSE